jgi:membrane-bound acyltransferase YfiQ involved in biofilm formation
MSGVKVYTHIPKKHYLIYNHPPSEITKRSYRNFCKKRVLSLLKSTWIISFICKIMGRLLLLHVVFDYTQNGKLTD